MSVGSFKIPVDAYYSKSSDFKSKVTELKDAVQNNFLDLVANNTGSLDSRDAASVEAIEAYTSAKTEIETIEDYETKLNDMSSEGDNNPINPVVTLDNNYSTTFSNISQGQASSDVSSVLETITSDVETVKEKNQLIEMINKYGSAVGDNDWVQRMLQLAGKNPAKALETLYSNEKFIETISKSESASKFFLGTMSYLEKAKGLPTALIDSISNSSAFYSWVEKLKPATQEKVLNGMITIADKGYNLLNGGGKLGNWATSIASGKMAGVVSSLVNSKAATAIGNVAKKFGESALGKVAANPWTAIAVETGIRSFGAYNDMSSETYHNVGKSVASGVIDTVANVGPVSGALIGASVGGPVGAVVGGFIGAGIQVVQFFAPDLKSKAKEAAYDAVDAVSKAGKAAAAKVGDVVSSAGKGFSKMASAVGGWFG